MSKRIVIIRNAYAHDFGGGERFPVFLAESLATFGYDPIIVSRNEKLLAFADTRHIPKVRGWWWSAQRWNGWRIILFPIYAGWQLTLYYWYRRLFTILKPDVVHIQSKDDFVAATYAASHLGIKVVWTDHADLKHIWKSIGKPLRNPLGKWVYKAANYTDAITVVSTSELNEATRHIPADSTIRNKISVVYNGCADVVDKYPPMTNKALVTYVIASRLVTDKGIGEAIEAFKQIHDNHTNTQLIIVGDGVERDIFTAQAAGIDSIKFIGHQSDPYKAISMADIFLQPTYHEGFSVVLVEASMLKKPIIASSVGGNVEIIKDHKTGLLVPARDVNSLVSAMEELYANKTLRDSLAKNARAQYEEEFVFDKIVKERFIPLYDKTTR